MVRGKLPPASRCARSTTVPGWRRAPSGAATIRSLQSDQTRVVRLTRSLRCPQRVLRAARAVMPTDWGEASAGGEVEFCTYAAA